MPKKLTQEEFIARAVATHGRKYDYSRAVYAGAGCKVLIICPEHGEFEQLPGGHLAGTRCYACGEAVRLKKRKAKESRKPSIKLTQAQFIERAAATHGTRYDYSSVAYKSSKDKISIICPEHGIFKQIANGHLRGAKCPNCAQNEWAKARILSNEQFLEKALAVHGGKYDYSKVYYKGSKDKVKIICPQHGEFEQMPNGHLNGAGCMACGHLSRNRVGTANFIARALEVHGSKYDYSQTEYTVGRSRVKIICPTHGPFQQMPGGHLLGIGCPGCGRARSTASSRLGWIKRAAGRICTLYLVRLYTDKESFYKIGVTYKSVKRRFAGGVIAGYSHELLAEHRSSNAAAVFDWEQSIIETFAHLRYKPTDSFIGATECFSEEALEPILEIFPL